MTSRIRRAWAVVLCGGTLMLSSIGCLVAEVRDPAATKRFEANLGTISMTVFPASVRKPGERVFDATAATRIAAALREARIGEMVVATEEVSLANPGRMNQARMVREGAVDFGLWVKTHPIATRYALLPDYLMRGDGTPGGIHGYIVDAAGTVVFFTMQNSAWDEWEKVQPKTVDDCTTVLIEALKKNLVVPGAKM